MTKRIIASLLILGLLTACTPHPGPSPTLMTAAAVAQVILEGQPSADGYAMQTGDTMGFYIDVYGLDSKWILDAAVYTHGGVDGREIAVMQVSTNQTDVENVAAALEEYRQNRLADFTGYAPEQAAIVEKGTVVQSDAWIALLLCEDMEAAISSFEDAAGQSSAWVSETPGTDFYPCDPPGKYDMTPYDLTLILKAWETGDETGLSDKDAFILRAAKAALEECGISEQTTAYDAELAVNDWLVQHCEYDLSAYNWWTPKGKKDNLNPYGVFAHGYGICLGYATSFQLMMDMIGIECVTVTGAAYKSREDHAWNMVRLDGEWYCVDVAWNDPVMGDPTQYSPEVLNEYYHRFFNVTSDYMRQTDHQWDYDGIPEATATIYAWTP